MPRMQGEQSVCVNVPVYYVLGNHVFEYMQKQPQWHICADIRGMCFTADLGHSCYVF